MEQKRMTRYHGIISVGPFPTPLWSSFLGGVRCTGVLVPRLFVSPSFSPIYQMVIIISALPTPSRCCEDPMRALKLSVVCILPGVVSGPMLTCLGLRWQTCMSDVNALFLCLWQTSPIDPSILSGSTQIWLYNPFSTQLSTQPSRLIRVGV